jgi:hypothetical protein
VKNGITEMIRASSLTVDQISNADKKINQLASQLALLTNQLVFSVEMIDKLALMINKKKASRNTLSNQLVAILNGCSADSNNAVAVTLTALNSCYVTMASSHKAKKITLLECKQSIELYGLLTGNVKVEADLIKKLSDVEMAKQRTLDDVNVTQKLAPPSSNVAEIPINTDLVNAQEELKKAQFEFDEMKKAREQALTENEHNYKEFSENVDKEEADLAEAQKRVDALIAEVKKLSASNITTTQEETPSSFETSALSLEDALTNFQQAVAQTLGFGATVELKEDLKQTSLSILINNANAYAVKKYGDALNASNMVIMELTQAQANLNGTTVELNSLKAGLAAATAASLAA